MREDADRLGELPVFHLDDRDPRGLGLVIDRLHALEHGLALLAVDLGVCGGGEDTRSIKRIIMA